MPRVPAVEGPSVQQQGLPDAYQRAPAALGQAGMVRAQQLGQAAQLAGEFAAMQQRERDEMDQVRVDDALNKLKERQLDLTFNQETGFTHQRGIAAIERQSGRPLADEYSQRLQEHSNELANGLGGERQKRMFGLRANDVVTGFRGQVKAHEGQQSDVYYGSVYEGKIVNRRNEIGKFWNDPGKIDEALVEIEDSVYRIGRRLGGNLASAEAIAARQRTETSKAIVGAVHGALEQNDYLSADVLLKKYSERMTADDLVKARGVVDKQIDAGVAQQTATAVIRAVQPTIQPTDFDRVLGITMQSESGGRRYGADGALLTSPKGAKGEMQVMDATMQAPGLGLKGLPKDATPEQRAQFGRDYMGALIKRYDGDLGKAWAAYNGGFARVDKAVEESQTPDMAKRGKFGQWLSAMPAETQAYVQKNLAAYQAGEGRPQPATIQDVHNAVRADPNVAKHPSRLKMTLDESTRQFEEMHKANKQRDDEATANAQRWLAANGGRYASMPASIRSSLPPAQVDNLLNFAERVSRGADQTNPAVYQRLSDPNVLRSMSETEFYIVSTRELSQSDRKHFANERQKMLTGAAADKPHDLNSGEVSRLLETRLRELGMDPTPKDGEAAAMRVGAIRRYVDAEVLKAQAGAGKKFNEKELQTYIDSLFAQTGVIDTWGPGGSSAPMLTMKASDIPSAVRAKLERDFKEKAGIEAPTDGQLLGAYWQAKTAAARRTITPLSTVKPKAGATGSY